MFKASASQEELLNLADSKTQHDLLVIELMEDFDITNNNEETHQQIGLLTLIKVIQLRLFEMNLKKKKMAVFLNTSTSIISVYLSGKRGNKT